MKKFGLLLVTGQHCLATEAIRVQGFAGSPGGLAPLGEPMMKTGTSRPAVDNKAIAAALDKQAGSSIGRKLGVGGCLSKAPIIPTIYVRSEKVRGMIELWKEKELIGKFVGIWPKEKDLVKWISSVWNPKGHYDLQLGSKGFLTIIFFN